MYEYIILNSTSNPHIPDSPFEDYNAIIPDPIKKRAKDLTYDLDDEDIIFAIGAHINNKPVGIAIVRFFTPNKTSELLTLYILPEYPQEDISIALIKKTIEELKKKKSFLCTHNYLKEDSDTPNLQRILTQTGWKGPRMHILRCLFDLETFDVPWMHYHLSYPPGFQEGLWKDITRQEREDLQYKECQGHFLVAVSPFLDEEKIETANSLVVRNNGEIVAWVICHRLNHNTIRFVSFYVQRDLRYKQISTKLLAKSILLAKRPPFKWADLEIPSYLTNHLWRQFVAKRLEPQAVKVTHIMQSWIDL